MNPTVRSWERHWDLSCSDRNSLEEEKMWKFKSQKQFESTGNSNMMKNQLGRFSSEIKAKKVVDLNHRYYAGSLWTNYFGSTELVDKREMPHTFAQTPQVLCHCFWHGLFCFPVKPTSAQLIGKSRPEVVCDQQQLRKYPAHVVIGGLFCTTIVHHFSEAISCFLRSVTVLSEDITANRRLKGPILLDILPVSCFPHNNVPYTHHTGGKSLPNTPPWESRTSNPTTLSCLSFLRQKHEGNKMFH